MDFFLPVPDSIKVSITNICNYKCLMCYNSSLQEKRGFIENKLFYDIVDQCFENEIKRISIGATGEPLMHRNFADYLRYAKSKDLWVSTTSNCSFLTKKIADEMIENRIDRFNISIYSSSPEEHEKYTGSNCFFKVVENVTYFLEEWANSGKTAEINMWFLPIPGVNNFDKYIQFWGPLAEKIGLDLAEKEQINWAGQVNLFKLNRFKLGRENGKMYFGWKNKTRCNHVRNYLHVLHNGDIVPCCVIPEVANNEEINFGNGYENRLMDVWSGDKYLEFKSDVFKKNYSQYKPCSRCSRIFEEKKVWISLDDLPGRLKQIWQN